MILILDDDPTSLFLLATILRRLGYPAIEFDDPAEALEHLRAQGDVELIISDLRMPTMSGLEFLAAVRQISSAHYTPILCCSSAHDAETVTIAISRGIRDYIVKPIDPAIVRQKVHSVLGDKGETIVSRDTMTARLGINGAEYRELVARTVDSVEFLIAELERAIEDRDSAEVSAIAERIEEPASVFGAYRCLEAVVGCISADDGPRRVETGRMLAHEVLLFRSALQRSTSMHPVSGKSTWNQTAP